MQRRIHILARNAAAALVAVGLSGWSPWCQAKVKVGDVPPDYLGRDFQGESASVSQYRGKVVVVTFWATWCRPCQNEMAVLEGAQTVAGPERLAVVAVNFNEDADTWDAMRRKLSGMALRITHDTREKVTEAYGVASIPHMYLIDKDGRVAAVHVGYSDKGLDQMLDELNALLVKPPASAADGAPAPAASP